MQQLGTQISERREAAGLTLEDLADKAQISRWYLEQIERGTGSEGPFYVTLVKIANALGGNISFVKKDPVATQQISLD